MDNPSVLYLTSQQKDDSTDAETCKYLSLGDNDTGTYVDGISSSFSSELFMGN